MDRLRVPFTSKDSMTASNAPPAAPDALRPVTLTRGYTVHAEGSVLVAFGDTQVLCTASVEEKVPPHKRGSGEGWVTAEYGMLPRATHTRSDREAARGKQSGRTQEIQRLIGRSMRSVFDLKALGERTIQLDCDVLQADGGTRTAAITGAFVAAHDAVSWLLRQGRIAASPIRDAVAAVSVGVVQGTPLLDLEYSEDSACDTDMNVVMTGRGGFVEVQGTAEGAPFTRAEMDALLALADQGIRELVGAQRAALAGVRRPSRLRLVLASNNARKLAELQALFAPLALELVRAGQPGHRRGRGAAPHLHRERAGQGAPRAHGQRPARRSPTTPACASMRSAARRAWSRRTMRRLAACPTADREAQRRPQDAANNACCCSACRTSGRPPRARFVCTLVALRPADDPEPLVAVGRWPGEMLAAPRGSGGFGYDPLMFIPALGATVAELTRELKNAHSHRALGRRQMLQLLRDAWHLDGL